MIKIESITQIYHQIFIIFILILMGVYLKKSGKVKEEVEDFIATLTIDFGFPALIFSSIITDFKIEILNQYIIFPLFGIIVTVLGISLSYFSGKKILKLDQDLNEYIFVSSYSNNIFIGVPVLMALFGQQGVIMGILYDFGMSLVLWSLGVWSLTKKETKSKNNPLVNLLSPPITALLLALVLIFFEISVPELVLEITNIVGGMTIPLAMFFIGIQLTRKNKIKLIYDQKVYLASFLRLLLIPLIILFITRFLNLSPLISGVLVIEAGMPVVASATVIMKKFNTSITFAAEAVFFTTLCMSFSIPFLYWLVN
jgi:hypothetical protein